MNSKYGWCVISPQLNFNTMVLQLYIYRLTIKLEQFYLMTIPFVHSVIFMLVTGASLEHQLSIFISQPTALGARTETTQVCQALKTKRERSNLNGGDFIFPHPGDGSGNKEKKGKKHTERHKSRSLFLQNKTTSRNNQALP